MEITHDLLVRDLDIKTQKALLKLGCILDGNMLYDLISENDLRWVKVKEIIKGKNICRDMRKTTFTKEELDAAQFFMLLGDWYNGYPRPKEGFRKTTYNLKNYCLKCGLGLVQSAPFRLKKEPRWGKRSFMKVNLVPNEFFVKPEVWKSVFEPLGIGKRPAIHHKTGKVLKDIVQLCIDTFAREKLRLQESRMFVAELHCNECRSLKCLADNGTGYYPCFEKMPENSPAIVRSQEWFGGGRVAMNDLIATAELVKTIQDMGLKGLLFIPMAPITSS